MLVKKKEKGGSPRSFLQRLSPELQCRAPTSEEDGLKNAVSGSIRGKRRKKALRTEKGG